MFYSEILAVTLDASRVSVTLAAPTIQDASTAFSAASLTTRAAPKVSATLTVLPILKCSYCVLSCFLYYRSCSWGLCYVSRSYNLRYSYCILPCSFVGLATGLWRAVCKEQPPLHQDLLFLNCFYNRSVKSCLYRSASLVSAASFADSQQVCEELFYNERCLHTEDPLVLLLIPQQVCEDFLYNERRLHNQNILESKYRAASNVLAG